MDFQGKYNIKSPAVKRLMREACELSESTEEYWAHPLEDNLFEWHFTVRGPPATDFDGGVYHGRILLPAEYPMKPPNIILLTPNGRFETNKKICLSISGHHPETWQPSWSIRTALMALIAFMPSPGGGTIGSLDYSREERQVLARRSQAWECPTCGIIMLQLSKTTSKPLSKEESTLISQIALKGEETSTEKVSVEQKQKENSTQPGRSKVVEETCENTPIGPSASNSLEGSENSSEMRQRLAGRTDVPEIVQAGIQVVQGVEVDSHNNNSKNMLMWFLIFLITLLLYRRLFLM